MHLTDLEVRVRKEEWDLYDTTLDKHLVDGGRVDCYVVYYGCIDYGRIDYGRIDYGRIDYGLMVGDVGWGLDGSNMDDELECYIHVDDDWPLVD